MRVIHMAAAARRLRVAPALLSSLKYRGLLDELELSTLANSTLVREEDLERIDEIIQRHTRAARQPEVLHGKRGEHL